MLRSTLFWFSFRFCRLTVLYHTFILLLFKGKEGRYIFFPPSLLFFFTFACLWRPLISYHTLCMIYVSYTGTNENIAFTNYFIFFTFAFLCRPIDTIHTIHCIILRTKGKEREYFLHVSQPFGFPFCLTAHAYLQIVQGEELQRVFA